MKVLLTLFAVVFSFQAVAIHATELLQSQTPRGTHYAISGDSSGSPAPTLFIIGNPISVMGQEGMRYLIGTGEILAKHGWRYVLLDPACEGHDVQEGQPKSLSGWATHAKNGHDFMGPYVRNCVDVLDHLIDEGITDGKQVVVQGVSRGGFCALHFAAGEPRIQAVVGISPVTNPLALKEFSGVTAAQVAGFSLDGVLEKMVNRTVWISIGNADDRVNSEDCIGFTRRLVATTQRLQPGLNLVPVHLHVGVSAGHRSPDDAYAKAAEFLLAQFPGKPASGVTRDVFSGDFPPASYGKNFEEVEATVQEVIERVFRDEDGILRSGVNGRTMKPLTNTEVLDRPKGKGGYPEHSAMPDALKAVWLNYENAGEASGAYLMALCLKYEATHDPKVRELARRTLDAIVTLWRNAAPSAGNGGGGRGWFPKPYAGIHKLAGIEECSADQYAGITLGLHAYHRTLADAAEKKQIEEVIVSFSDWWHDHDHSGVYFGKPIWWKRLEWHPMAAAYFLYLHALAESWRPSAKSRQSFETWLALKATLLRPDKATGITMHGLPVLCLEQLHLLRPDLDAVWQPALVHQAALLARSVDQTAQSKHFEVLGYGADYLGAAHRLLPDAGYDKLALRCLETLKNRGDFYHIRREQRIDQLPPLVSGDDYRDVFFCEGHVHWMAGYWRRQLQK
ncbi:prolyl oligopeptidase family protein [Roseimicrobium gellanilyticum]|uniref:Prolyl oligopeptidase family protein n=1 Tax=Roseimicrobium gellanilyticum TaxID=748857 RepID=A0A366HGY3_9BACT|nr:prolyl oligopeptidase family serine peptidase [Roseimicrobium gellanilyticum]RBP41330.1 prolyl oligopeptidase family protein [Roseimicrobium gellanilyticum]